MSQGGPAIKTRLYKNVLRAVCLNTYKSDVFRGHGIYVRRSTQKFGEFDHKKILTVTPSFHSLFRSIPPKFGEFKQPRGLLWELGVTVRILLWSNFPNFWVYPRTAL
jgi:hypothetical protein